MRASPSATPSTTGALVPNQNEGVRSTLLDPVDMIIINSYGFQCVYLMCSSILNFSNFVQALVVNIALWSSLNTFIITLTHFCNLRNLTFFVICDVAFTTCVTELSSHQDNSMNRSGVLELDAYIWKDKLKFCLKWSQCCERDLQSWLDILFISVLVENAFLSWTFIEM